MIKKAVLLALLLAAGEAQGAPLVTDISERLIAITSGFQGTDLLLFGSVQDSTEAGETVSRGQADIIIVVRGPEEPVVVRRKGQVGGIWVNRQAVQFDHVPGYYAVLSNRPLEDIAPRNVMARHGIGSEFLDLKPADTRDENVATSFRQAIIRSRTQNSLFIEQDGAVAFLGGTLFRADVHFPANVPVGDYRAEVYLLRDGQVVGAQGSGLFIAKSGIERRIYNLAHNQPTLYGLIAVTIAVLAGWFAAMVFRRD